MKMVSPDVSNTKDAAPSSSRSVQENSQAENQKSVDENTSESTSSSKEEKGYDAQTEEERMTWFNTTWEASTASPFPSCDEDYPNEWNCIATNITSPTDGYYLVDLDMEKGRMFSQEKKEQKNMAHNAIQNICLTLNMQNQNPTDFENDPGIQIALNGSVIRTRSCKTN